MPRAFDAKPDNVAVPQLVHLHARLTARLAESRATAKRTATDIKHVEAVIRLFDPAFDVRRIPGRRRNKPNPFLRKGTAWLNAVGVLRTAEKPLTVREVAERVLTKHGFALDKKAVFDMVNALHASFTNHKGKSIVRVGNEQPARWQLASR